MDNPRRVTGDTADMGFWEHVEALRGVLLRMLAVLAVAAAGWFAVMPRFFDAVIMAPCRPDFPLYRLLGAGWLEAVTATGAGAGSQGAGGAVQLVNIQLASQFFTHMATSCWMAVITAFPLLLRLMWGFVAPGLYESEKRGARRVFAGACAMFYLGVACGYWLVFPLTLRFLADYHISALIPNTISLDSYIDTFLMLLMVMGVVFELPVAAWLAGRAGLLKRGFFSRYRRHAVVALLLLTAVVTPTGDPFTLLAVFAPVYLLWELGAHLVPASDDNLKPETTENP